MLIFFNWIGLAMLAISIAIWAALASSIPEIGGGVILVISIGSLFLIDVLYRITVVKKRIILLKEQSTNDEKSVLRKDLNASFPMPISVAITNLGGSFMLLPCWVFSILLGLFFFYAVS